MILITQHTAARTINLIGMDIALAVLWGSLSYLNIKGENNYLKREMVPIILKYAGITSAISIFLILVNLKSVILTLIVQIACIGAFAYLIYKNKDEAVFNYTAEDKEKSRRNIEDITKKIEYILKTTDNKMIYPIVEEAYNSIKCARINIDGDSEQIDSEIMNTILDLSSHIKQENITEIKNDVEIIINLVNRRNQLY